MDVRHLSNDRETTGRGLELKMMLFTTRQNTEHWIELFRADRLIFPGRPGTFLATTKTLPAAWQTGDVR